AQALRVRELEALDRLARVVGDEIGLAPQLEDRDRQAQLAADLRLHARREDVDSAAQRTRVLRLPQGPALPARDGGVIVADELRVAVAGAPADAELELLERAPAAEERPCEYTPDEVRVAVDLRAVLAVTGVDA